MKWSINNTKIIIAHIMSMFWEFTWMVNFDYLSTVPRSGWRVTTRTLPNNFHRHVFICEFWTVFVRCRRHFTFRTSMTPSGKIQTWKVNKISSDHRYLTEVDCSSDQFKSAKLKDKDYTMNACTKFLHNITN